MASFLYLADGEKDIHLVKEMIWKIEVSLVHPDPGKKYFYWKGNKAFSTDDANAVRMYRLYIGTDVYNIISNPDWEVSQFLEKLTLGAEDIQRN